MSNTEESESLNNPLQTQIALALYNEEPETLTRQEALSYWKASAWLRIPCRMWQAGDRQDRAYESEPSPPVTPGIFTALGQVAARWQVQSADVDDRLDEFLSLDEALIRAAKENKGKERGGN
jgi:hypothetical protein